MTRELPIDFAQQLVPGLLDGTKTQTRRTVKLPKGLAWSDFEQVEAPEDGGPLRLVCYRGQRHPVVLYPRYRVGEIVWVREAILVAGTGAVFYRADGEELADGFGWIPSVQMPKEIARVFLRVDDVRVERVQDISDRDAMAEGIKRWDQGPLMLRYGLPEWNPTSRLDSARNAFAYLWESIHGRGSWNSNPWVWAYRFTRLENYRAAA